MKSNFKRVVFYLILNVFVSALTTWIVVSLMLNFNVLKGFDAISSNETSGIGAGISQQSQSDLPLTEDVVITNVIGAGNLENEYVELQQKGDIEVNMEGWQLVDEQGNTYTFPGLTLHSGGAVRVYTKLGPLSAIELYWGLDGAVWSAGEQVVLLDAENNLHASYQVP